MNDSLVEVLGWHEALAGQVGYWPIYASAWPVEIGIALICAAVAYVAADDVADTRETPPDMRWNLYLSYSKSCWRDAEGGR